MKSMQEGPTSSKHAKILFFIFALGMLLQYVLPFFYSYSHFLVMVILLVWLSFALFGKNLFKRPAKGDQKIPREGAIKIILILLLFFVIDSYFFISDQILYSDFISLPLFSPFIIMFSIKIALLALLGLFVYKGHVNMKPVISRRRYIFDAFLFLVTGIFSLFVYSMFLNPFSLKFPLGLSPIFTPALISATISLLLFILAIYAYRKFKTGGISRGIEILIRVWEVLYLIYIAVLIFAFILIGVIAVPLG